MINNILNTFIVTYLLPDYDLIIQIIAEVIIEL